MADRGRVKVEPGHKRIRAYFAGQLVVDTVRPLYVWEAPYYPTYYLPVDDVRRALLVDSDTTDHSPSRGDARFFHVRVGDREATDAVRQYPDSPIEELRGSVRVEWDAMDAWFEEDVEVYVHARSPYARVDVLPSSRHVQVEVDGVIVAD